MTDPLGPPPLDDGVVKGVTPDDLVVPLTALNHVELAKSRVPRPARLLVLWSAELLERWVST